MFVKLFTLAKLPIEMSPSQHRKIQPTTYLGVPGEEASAAAGPSTPGSGGHHGGSPISGGSSPRSIRHRMVSLRRRLSDACGAVAINARRPSIRAELITRQGHIRQYTKPRGPPVCSIKSFVPASGRTCSVSYTHLTLPTNREV